MEQKCPHCGFLQPKDEFCANCGIHIERYRKKISLLIKKKIIFYSLLCFSIATAFLFYFNFLPLLPFDQKTKNLKTSKPDLTGSSIKEKNNKQEKITKTAIQPTNLRTPFQEGKNPSKRVKKDKTLKNPEKIKNKIKPEPHLEVLLAEIPKESIDKLFEKEEAFSNRALLILKKKSLQSWIESLDGKVLLNKNQKKILKNQKVDLNFKLKNTFLSEENVNLEEEIDLNVSVSELETEKNTKLKTIELDTKNFLLDRPIGFYGRFEIPIQKFLLLLGEFPKSNDLKEEIDSHSNNLEESELNTTEAGFVFDENPNLPDVPLTDAEFLGLRTLETEIVLILQFETN